MPYRPLYEIAQEIRNDWSKQGKGINYAAKPYLEAMFALDKMTDKYGADDAKTIVIYFLANAGTWRGEVAKRVKAELNAMYKKPLAEANNKKVSKLLEMLQEETGLKFGLKKKVLTEAVKTEIKTLAKSKETQQKVKEILLKKVKDIISVSINSHEYIIRLEVRFKSNAASATILIDIRAGSMYITYSTRAGTQTNFEFKEKIPVKSIKDIINWLNICKTKAYEYSNSYNNDFAAYLAAGGSPD